MVENKIVKDYFENNLEDFVPPIDVGSNVVVTSGVFKGKIGRLRYYTRKGGILLFDHPRWSNLPDTMLIPWADLEISETLEGD